MFLLSYVSFNGLHCNTVFPLPNWSDSTPYFLIIHSNVTSYIQPLKMFNLAFRSPYCELRSQFVHSSSRICTPISCLLLGENWLVWASGGQSSLSLQKEMANLNAVEYLRKLTHNIPSYIYPGKLQGLVRGVSLCCLTGNSIFKSSSFWLKGVYTSLLSLKKCWPHRVNQITWNASLRISR